VVSRNICSRGGRWPGLHAAKTSRKVSDVVAVGAEAAVPYASPATRPDQLAETGLYPYTDHLMRQAKIPIIRKAARLLHESRRSARRRQADDLCQHWWRSILDGTIHTRTASPAVQQRRFSTPTQAVVAPTEIDWVLCDGLGTQMVMLPEVMSRSRSLAPDLAGGACPAPSRCSTPLMASTVDVAMAPLGQRRTYPAGRLAGTQPGCADVCSIVS